MQVNFSRDSTGVFSVLQVVFLLQRHTGYFLIQVRAPVSGWLGSWGALCTMAFLPGLMNESEVMSNSIMISM